MSQTSSAETARPPAEARVFQEGFLQALCTIFLHSEHTQHFNLQWLYWGPYCLSQEVTLRPRRCMLSQHSQVPLAQWCFFSKVSFGLKTFHIVHSLQPELIVFTKFKHTFEPQSTSPIKHCCQHINCKSIHSTGHVPSLSGYKYQIHKARLQW